MPNSKELSIIIVNYRSEQYLKNCVASLFKYLQKIDFEIIVVNNDAQEQLAEIKVNYPEALVVDHKRNIGFGAGCNLGAKNAQGEVLWFLNPDTQIISSEAEKIIRKFSNDKGVGVIGAKLVDEKNNVQKWIAGQEITLASILANNFGYTRDKKIWESEKAVACAWVSGGAMFVRKNMFKKLQGFDEKFFMYFEDVDLCKRARLADYSVWHYPEIAVKHLGGRSRKSFIKQKMQYYKSLVYFLTNV